MKNFVKWLGIINIVAVIGFSMAACEDTKDAEYFEATTAGRLTITGLSAFEGKGIYADNFSAGFAAYERAQNGYNPNENESYRTETFPGTVTNGQAVLKVFVDRGLQSGKNGGWQSYTDNEQNVELFVTIGSGKGENTHFDSRIATGNINVNFSNGIADINWANATNVWTDY